MGTLANAVTAWLHRKLRPLTPATHRAIPKAAIGVLFALLTLFTPACADSERTAGSFGDTVPITLPDGAVIHAELATSPEEQARGLMFRRELAPDRGMIFHFADSQPRPFWMFQTLIPLDIIWMNEQGVIVEISPDTPPCGSTDPDGCSNYGGSVASRYVLELAAGEASAHQVIVGGSIRF